MMARNKTYIKLINSSKWRVLRNRKISKNPLCEKCLEKGLTTPATAVHHIKPVETGLTYPEMRSLAYTYSNLMSVCISCHVELHQELESYNKESISLNNKRYTQRFINKFF